MIYSLTADEWARVREYVRKLPASLLLIKGMDRTLATVARPARPFRSRHGLAPMLVREAMKWAKPDGD